jgi:tetratricopeptide (TPR) repeat protein
VSDEAVGVGSGTEGNGAGIDPTAVALALAGASREKADSFLENQNGLIAAQRHHLSEQIKHLHLDMWEKRLGVWLRAATFIVGIAIVSGAAYLIWDASHSNGLLIEPFSVPPDLASRGLTGEVVAAQVHDRILAMQAQSTSNRAAKTYANSWDQTGIKLDIPETGVSMAELDSFLREKLGHDTHVRGEIIRTATGLSLTVRAGADGADSVAGSEAELDALIQKSAESVYRLTQPYRYAFYLATNERQAEAVPIFMTLARRGPSQERPWGYLGWSSAISDSQGADNYIRLMKQTLALQPDNVVALVNIAQIEDELSQPEQAVRDATKALSTLSGRSQAMIRAESIPFLIKASQSISERQSGAFHEAASEQAEVVQFEVGGVYSQPAILASVEIGEHDLSAARTAMSFADNPAGPARGRIALNKIRAQMLFEAEVEDWAKILSQANAADPVLIRYPGLRTLLPTTISPVLALAEAKLGKFASAEARIVATPTSCYRCLIARARIAELQNQRGRADWWFAQATSNAPSIPFANSEWGQALVSRGDVDGAIAKFTLANQNGPHFADPLEGWGEALMAKNQSHLALAKFAEADKFAPNWGRLHLKWGEALVYAGKKDKAEAQFSRAAQLDLTPSEKSELALHP